MVRKIIQINEEQCNGCGACAAACHEGAIGTVNGKAKLLRDDYCDGLGDCLPVCPTGAIRIVEREAAAYDEDAAKICQIIKKELSLSETAAYDEKAVKAAKQEKTDLPCGCPGTNVKEIHRSKESCPNPDTGAANSQLSQWPVQIKLVPENAPYFEGANLLIAADCTAYAYGDFHNRFIRGRITLVGCPKLDSVDYTEKLAAIIRKNDIKSVTIVRMEVPCCGGLEQAAKAALQSSGKFIPWRVVTVSTDGRILSEI